MSYLADCVVPLDDDQREALHEFWDRMIADELGPIPAANGSPSGKPVDGSISRSSVVVEIGTFALAVPVADEVAA
ncbi:hypothetical protein [Pseudonocardia sp. Ae331_Ps2]|nr:hypothetical protein [Pseudonocardia sp. Ae331_Ps2]